MVLGCAHAYADACACACACNSPVTRERSDSSSHVHFTPQASGLSRYIKKKTLDPLETYVPLVLEAQEQLLALRGKVGGWKTYQLWSPSIKGAQRAYARGPSINHQIVNRWHPRAGVLQCSLHQPVLSVCCPVSLNGSVATSACTIGPSIARDAYRRRQPPMQSTSLPASRPRSPAPPRPTPAADPARAREQLRVGAFSALRDNVRALGEYAQQSGAVKDAGVLVNGFFRKLEAFDLLLYRVVKDQAELDGEEAEGKLLEAADALADLIATVPADVLERSRKVLDKVQGRSSSEQVAGGEAPAVAPEAKQLSPEDVELLNELLTVWE